MQNEWLMGFSTTINERSNILKIDNDPSLKYLKMWRQRKTLVTDDNFMKMLEYRQMTSESFNTGIAPMTEERLKELFEYVKKQRWYGVHQQLFSVDLKLTDDLDSALRYHLHYFKGRIINLLKNYPLVNFSHKALLGLNDWLLSDLMNIAKRTLVWDVHETKKRMWINAPTPEEEFKLYLKLRFITGEKTSLFYLEYPALAKLLVIRLEFIINNTKQFLKALTEAHNDLKSNFKITAPFKINTFCASCSDSHNQGKTAIIFTINQIKLVFKFRQGKINTSFNHLLSWLETLNLNYKFYKINTVSGSDYCFEEFVEHKSCASDNELKRFYKNFGYLLAIAHWLGTTDLHMENLIAHADHPVLIDLETLLRTENIRTYELQLSKSQSLEKNSVVTSGLLPMKKYWKRQLELSALTGTKQRLPFKVRKIAHERSSDVSFKLSEHYIEEAYNRPLLNGKEVDHQQYASAIEDGFLQMNKTLLKHKNEFAQKIKQLFNDCQIRTLLRDTQDYNNFIAFATHPSCMTDFIERERIFENLWDHAFINASVVEHEISALINNDIPHFIVHGSATALQTESHRLNSYFKHTIIDFTNLRIRQLNNNQIRNHYFLLKESLDTLSLIVNRINIPQRNTSIDDLLLQRAADIGDYIIDYIILPDTDNFLVWSELSLDEENQITLEFPSANLYNGSSGLFIFYYYLNSFIYKNTYSRMICILEKEVFSQSSAEELYQSAFFGRGAQLTAATFAYRLAPGNKYKQIINNILNKIDEDIHFDNYEWIYGAASLIKCLVSLYQTKDFGKAQIILDKLIQNVNHIQMKDIGFAHGYSGIIYALSEASQYLDSPKLSQLQRSLNQKYDQIARSDMINNSWCRGRLGLFKIGKVDSLAGITHLDSCLCHGLYGESEFFIGRYQSNLISYKEYLDHVNNLISLPIYLKGDPAVIPIGLFTGVSGIGYQLLRMYNPELVPSILFF